MKYDKPSLKLDEQVQLLIERGMQGDPEYIASKLKLVSYYRLSAYWRIFRNNLDYEDESFNPDTQFSDVWDLYVFDRRLRLHFIDAIERIEVAVRSKLAYHHSITYGPFGYADVSTSLNLNNEHDHNLLDRILGQVERSNVEFISHFKSKYGDYHQLPPVWMSVEVISFGTLVSLYRCMPYKIKKAISYEFKVNAPVLESWLTMLRSLRNICAHHGRIWNLSLPTKPMFPSTSRRQQWDTPVPINNNNIYAALTICKYCVDIVAPNSKWDERLRRTIYDLPPEHLLRMGFNKGWDQHAIWVHKSH